MTTPEQLLADAKWRARHSVYTLWALFIGFGFVSLFYTGVRSKKNKWTAWGVVYGVIVIGAIAIGGSLSPDDPDAPTPLGANVAYTVLMIVWVVSAIHVFRERKEWLRWKAASAGRPQWFETGAAAPVDAPLADLSGIDMEDPTGEYLGGPPPAPVSEPVTSQRLPPPPVAPPPHAQRNPPPPPPAPAPPATTTTTSASSESVDLNTASVDALAALPGVGVATATRIIEERKRRGGFESVEEAAVAVAVQPHVRARLQQLTFVSERERLQRRRTSGRIVDI